MVCEYDRILNAGEGPGEHVAPPEMFRWLEEQSLGSKWDLDTVLTLSRKSGRRSVQVGRYAGILQAPNGFQLEVLPKIGRRTSHAEARLLLLKMVKSAPGFRHMRSWPADIKTSRMPLLEVFIGQFLLALNALVKRGLRGGYVASEDNRPFLRGKLKVASHLRQNRVRRDRFLAEQDDFLLDRPENRLLNSALQRVIGKTQSSEHQRLARELAFAFVDVPQSTDVRGDFRRIRLERTTAYYKHALEWARLILEGMAPIGGRGNQEAPSLLFPMDALFEAHVERRLARQLVTGYRLRRQVRSQYLVEHRDQKWFNLKPDLLIEQDGRPHVVLDTKWKLLDSQKATGREKYDLSQADLYQLFAYGQHYLRGAGDVVLIYPKTDSFTDALPVFTFPQAPAMRLWVLPFCFKSDRLLVPEERLLFNLFEGFVSEQELPRDHSKLDLLALVSAD